MSIHNVFSLVRGRVLLEKERHSLTEICAIIGIKASTLRKYEKDYNLSVPRNELGYRFYTDNEISLLRKIISLKEQGENIHRIRKQLGLGIDRMVVSNPNANAENYFIPKEIAQEIANELRPIIAEEIELRLARFPKDLSGIRSRLDEMERILAYIKNDLPERLQADGNENRQFAEAQQEKVIQYLVEAVNTIQQFILRQIRGVNPNLSAYDRR